MTKMGREYSTIWSVDFTDDWFRDGLRDWLATGASSTTRPMCGTCQRWPPRRRPSSARRSPPQLQADKAIIGVFDEGCMGMYNAIIDDELLNPLGIYKERLSQSALWAEMQRVGEDEAAAVGEWLTAKGMTFKLGTDEATELTAAQVAWQYKMYVAALRIADDFGLDAVGIQYQQGLKDLAPASDLVEGLLNNVDRPPVTSRDGQRILFEGVALPNFNEVDEGVAVDALITNRVWRAMGLDPATTLHDVRWGEDFDGPFRLGLRDLRLGAAVAPRSRLRRGGRLAAEPDVLPGRGRHDQGRGQARRDRVVAALHRRRAAAPRHRPRLTRYGCRRRRPSAAGA